MNRHRVDGSSVNHRSAASLSGKLSINWERTGKVGASASTAYSHFPPESTVLEIP